MEKPIRQGRPFVVALTFVVRVCAKLVDKMGGRQPRCRFIDAQRGWAATRDEKRDFARALLLWLAPT